MSTSTFIEKPTRAIRDIPARRSRFIAISEKISDGEKPTLNASMNALLLEPAVMWCGSPNFIGELRTGLTASAAIIQGMDDFVEKKPEAEFAPLLDKMKNNSFGLIPNEELLNFLYNRVGQEMLEDQFNAMKDEQRVFEDGTFPEYVDVACRSNGLQKLIRDGLLITKEINKEEKLSGEQQVLADSMNKSMRFFLDILKWRLDAASNPPSSNIVLKWAEINGEMDPEIAADQLMVVASKEWEDVLARAHAFDNQIFDIYGFVIVGIKKLAESRLAKAYIEKKAKERIAATNSF